MAESESAPKAMDLYLGVVELFGTMLPGALLTFVANRIWGCSLRVPEDWPKETNGWAEFLVVSYVAGHLVHALGSMILDPLYDYTYKLWKTRKYVPIRARAVEVVRAALGPFWMEGDNNLDWSTTFLRLHGGALSAAIDRLEADSKFFRSLTVVLLFAWPMYVLSLGGRWFYWLGAGIPLLPVLFFALLVPAWGPRGKDLERRKREHLATASTVHMQEDDLIVGAFRKAMAARLAKRISFQAEALAEANANKALSRSWLQRVIQVTLLWAFLIVGWAVCVVWFGQGARPEARSPLFVAGACGYVLLTLFAGLRFMELRLKRTELTYSSVIALFTLRPLFESRELDKGEAHKG